MGFKIEKLILMLSFVLVGLLPTKLSAQPFSVIAYTIDCGGGSCANGGFQLNGGIGQHDAGQELMGATFTLTGGFWVMSASELILGDVNGDGEVNLLDVVPFVDAVTTGTYIPEADINGDGVVNLLDVAPFIDLLSG